MTRPLAAPAQDARAARARPAARYTALLPTTVLLGLLALLAAGWASRIVDTPDHWLWNLDLPKIDYPLAVYAHEALAAGHLPLWIDRMGLGFPLYAEGQVAPFYPPSWFVFQLPPLVALDVYRVLHLAFAGVGAGLLVLRIRGSRPGAVVAVLVAVLGGAIVAKLEWHNLVAAYAWLPWILLPLLRRPRPTRLGLVASGTAYGIQALAGHPNTWLLTGIVVLVVLMAGRDGPWKGMWRAVLVGALGTAVGAVQLIPTALLTSMSVRSTALSPTDLFASAATPFDVLAWAFQGAFAPVQNGSWDIHSAWYPDGGFALFEAAAYVGLPVLGLALGGALLRRTRPLGIAVLVLVAIPVIEAFRPGFIASVPFVNALRSPVRAYLPASLLVGVLAGSALGRRTSIGLRPIPVAIGVGIPIGLYVLTLAVVTVAPGVFDQVVLAVTAFGDLDSVARNRELTLAALRAPWPVIAEFAAGIAIVVVAAAAGRGFVRRRAAVLAALVAAVPLLLVGPAPNGSSDVGAFTSRDSAFVKAVLAAEPRRLLTIGSRGWYAGTPDQPAAAGIADLRMFSSLNLRDVDQITDAAASDDPAATDLRRAIGVDILARFGEPCTSAEVAQSTADDATICRDDRALRPPYWVPAAAVNAIAARDALIGPRHARLDPAAAVASAVPAKVAWRDDTGLEATVSSASDGWAWIDRAWWPGWMTFVDGQPVETLEALGGQLVAVPAGTHLITQRMVPVDALAGLLIGVVALAVALLWVARGRRVSP